MDRPEAEPDHSTPISAGDEAALMERAREWLRQVLHKMGIEAGVKIAEGQLEIEAGTLSESQKAYLLASSPSPTGGSHSAGEFGGIGITLDALQYLANTLLNLNQPSPLQRSYTIELDGYRDRRQRELQTMALGAVDQVRTLGSEQEFKALSAAERRLLHTFFDQPEYSDLECFSRGKEPDRRLVVRLAKQPQGEGEQTPDPEERAIEPEIAP